MKMNFKKIFFYSITASLLLASSCTLGLGDKVDTESPVLSINYPPENSVIRNSFVVSGECTDDKGISSLYVEVKYNNSDSNSDEVLHKVNAKLQGKKWSVTLNEDLSLLDGKYKIEAYAKDGAGHITKNSAHYDIDNTAPCLLLTKPMSVGSEDPNEFGQAIKIAGNISEVHKTSSLVLNLQECDPETRVLKEGTEKQIEVQGFSTMDAENPLIIAKYYSQEQIDAEQNESVKQYYASLRKNYFDIYGVSSEEELFTTGDKVFYANIQLTDNAMEFKNPDDNGVGPGNVSEVYYVNSSEFSENLKDENGEELTATAISEIIKGTSNHTEAQRAEILEKLKSYSISSKKEDLNSECSVFLVNPDNNPFYTVANCALESGYAGKTPNSQVTINLKAGKDSVAFNPSQVSVTVYKMDDETDTSIAGKSPENKNAWILVSKGAEKNTETTNYSISISVTNTELGDGSYTDTFFSAGDYYLIKVDGVDLDGNTIVSESKLGYGFMIKSIAVNPTVSLITENDLYISGNALNTTGKTIELTVTTAGKTSIPSVTMMKGAESADSKITMFTSSAATEAGVMVTEVTKNTQYKLPEVKSVTIGDYTEDEDGYYTYPVTVTVGGNGSYLPKDDDGNEIIGKFKYSFNLVASDSVGNNSPSSIVSFYVNNVEPKVQNTKVTPVESDNKVNGVITFSANATTNYEMESVAYKVFVGDEVVATGITDADNSDFGTLIDSVATFNTAEKSEYDNKELKIEITAVDKVGNSFSSVITGYVIDQSSDLPTLNVQNFTVIEKDAVKGETNVFDKNSKLIGNFADTDGIGSASYLIKDSTGTVVVEETTISNKSGNFSIPVPASAGYYQVVLSATDSTYDADNEYTKQFRKVSKEFWIAVDNAAPSIALKTIDGSEENLSSVQYKKADTVIFAGTVSDDCALDTIEVYLDDVLLSDKPAILAGNWTYSLDMKGKAAGVYSIKFKAIDNAGKTKELTSSIKKDVTKPVFGSMESDKAEPKLSVTSVPTNGWFNDSSVEIRGFVKDEDSPIQSVEYSVDGTNFTPLNIEYVDNNTSKVIYTGTVVGIANDKNITIRATDAAGNLNETNLENTLKVDKVTPVITVTHYADSVADGTSEPLYKASTDVVYSNGKKPLYLKGAATDTVPEDSDSGSSGVSAVYLRINNVPSAKEDGYDVKAEISGNVWTASYTAESIKATFGTESSSGTLYALVVDNAGNSTTIAVTTFVYDVTYPSADITKAKYYGTDRSVTYANKKVTFEGTASDNQSVSSIYLEYTLDKEDSDSWEKYPVIVEGANNWSIVVNTEDSCFEDGKKYYFRAVAVDAVGNTGNSGNSTSDFTAAKTKEGVILQSSDIPSITFSNISFVENMSATKTAWLKNSSDLYVSASDDDGVSNVQYKIGEGIWQDVRNNKINFTEDATYKISFRVKDVYTEDYFTQLVLCDENNSELKNTGVLYLSIDKTPPVMTDVAYYLYDGQQYPETGSTTTSGIKLGEEKNKLKITLKASDKNGVSKVEVIKDAHVWKGSSTETVTDAAAHTWTVEVADSGEDTYLEDLSAGTYEFILRVTDSSGSIREKPFSINIDDVPASISITSHSDNEIVGTNFVLKGTVEDADSETKIRYLVNGTADEVRDWNSAKEYTGTIASWRINVDGETAADDGETHTDVIKTLFMQVYGTSKNLKIGNDGKIVYASGAKENEPYTELQPLYFHILTKDSVGNIGTAVRRLRADPQGDRPTVKMTSPVATDLEKNTVILSGPIRAQGEASTVTGATIMGIYMQIDPNYKEAEGFNADAWKKTAQNNPADSIVTPYYKDAGGNVVKLSTLYAFENILEKYNAQGSVTNKRTETATQYNDYGIYVGNKNSWNITINKSGELNGESSNVIGVRLIIVDSKGDVSETEPLIITLDSNAPIFGAEQFKVYQFGWKDAAGNIFYTNTKTPDSSTALYTDPGCTVAANKNWSASYTESFTSEVYQDDMSLKGVWWLSGSVEDHNDIYKVECVDDPGYVIALKNNGDKNGAYTAESANAVVTRYKNPDTNNSGFIFNLKVGSDVPETFNRLTYTITAYQWNVNEDLRKPTTKEFIINYDNKKPEVRTDSYYNISTKVVNSYGSYKLGTAVYETGANGVSQSGFARTVFYFTKSGNVFDPAISKGETGNTVSQSLTGVEEYNDIYWKTSTVTAVSLADSTITISAADANIHEGSLVYLGGVYYLVKEVDSTDKKVITLNKQPADDSFRGKVYFALGNVVDAGDSKKVSLGSVRSIWEDSINSNNLPDGPAQLHCVVFDEAGNYNTLNPIDVLIGNNAPRYASVKIWSDFNGNNSEEADDEVKYYYYSEKKRYIKVTEDGKDVVKEFIKASAVTDTLNVGTVAAPFMILKDKTVFSPEIVGGNGALYYSYKYGAEDQVNVSASIGNGHNDGNIEKVTAGSYMLSDENGETYISGHSDFSFTVAADTLASLTQGNQIFTFTIWDSADGSETFNATKCLSAALNIAVNVKRTDNTAPKTNVKPFFYESVKNNSMYHSSGYTDFNDFKGHIELKEDVTAKIAEKTAGTTALGYDPKVSGIITIRGTAFDDIRLKELKVKFGSHGKIGANYVTAATYNTNGSWTSSMADTDSNMSSNGWSFFVTDRYSNETGHLVDWECNIDTSFITGVAAIDQVFSIVAVDERGTSDSSTISTEARTDKDGYDASKEADEVHCPSYQMDVVPYITTIITSLSGVEESNPSVYDRSALGHYTTYAGEKNMKLKGFNFAKGNGNKAFSNDSFTTSGLYEEVISNVPTLNNLNGDVEYNKRPNGVNNDILTDDVYVDVWQINGTAITPSDNQVLNMNMMINQSSGLIGYGFNNGTYSWSMPYGTTAYTSYARVSDFTRCSSFTYDALGNSYGAFLPGTDGSGYFFYSSRWYNQRPNVVANNWNENTKIDIGNNQYQGTQDKERYQGATYATLIDSNNSTCLYMTVFDQLKNCITLNYGYVVSTNTNTSLTAVDLDIENPSEYCSVGVTQSDANGKHKVVVVWFDGAKLMYAYKSFTYNASNYTITPGTEDWNVVEDLMPKGGKYCRLAIDNADGVHIAAYDTEGLNLNYIYIDRVDADSDDAVIKRAVVDSYNNVGTQLTIDVAKVGDYQIPYISYLGTYPKRPRYAYLAEPKKFYDSDEGLNGAEEDKYTGIWECTIVPSSNIFFEDPYSPQRMCVGVWKNKNSIKKNGSGVLTTSPGTTGKGNGSSNAVIAYLSKVDGNNATNRGETAQLK